MGIEYRTFGDKSVQLTKVILMLLSIVSFSVVASTEDEIAHLLKFVELTECKYERNGTRHKGAEAVKHINKKYQYYLDDIKSTEDFIKYSATKSTMSGKHYIIHCPDNTVMKSRDWLLIELKRYRKSNVSLL